MTQIAETNFGYVEKLVIAVMQKPVFNAIFITWGVDSKYQFLMKY